MGRRFSEIKNSNLSSTDRKLGRVTDLLFEDNNWSIRYLVVNLGSLLTNRDVLIAPAAIASYDLATNTIATILTSQQAIGSPELDSDRPISREYEQSLVDYYGWPIYWFGRDIQMKPQVLSRLASDDVTDAVNEESASNLRSATEICGYEIQSQNGLAGVLRDLVVNLSSWTIDFATAELQPWIPRDGAVFSTKWISQVDWASQHINVDVSEAVLERFNPPIDQAAIVGGPLSARLLRTT